MTELRQIPNHTDVYPAIAANTYAKDEFKNKVVIVTGSGGGIGKATGLAFSELGACVAFTDLTQEAAQSAADEATGKFGNKTIAVAGDVTKIKDNEKLVKETREKLGPIDIVVFCAGYDWWGLIELNLKAPTDLTRMVLPEMIKRNTGSLIYMASRAGIGDNAYTSAYNVSKAGLIRFAGTLQTELKDTNIRTYALHPGQVKNTKLGDINYVTKPYVRELEPEIPKLIGGILNQILDCDPRLPAWSCCFLASSRVMKVQQVLANVKGIELKGRYIDCCQDLGELVNRIDEVKEKKLNLLKADLYPTAVFNPRDLGHLGKS